MKSHQKTSCRKSRTSTEMNVKQISFYASEELNPEDFYADDEMIITISHMGYIKRTPLSEFRAQGRGGVGAKRF